jgi:hypothetical protein
MAVYSVNQATHLYVVADIPSVKTTEDGDVKIVGLGANKDLATDLINKNKVFSATHTTVEALAPTVKAKTITVTTTEAGEYIMRVIIDNYFSESPSGSYIKHASAYVGVGATAEKIAEALEASLKKGLKRDIEPAFAVTRAGAVITITPLATEWVLGRKASVIPAITVELVPADPMEAEASWGKVEEAEADVETVAPNRNLAIEKLRDYEYFCLGERGDQYRGIGWPNNVETKGEGDKITADDYVVTVHYYEDLSNEAVQKSEKTAVFVGPKANVNLILTALGKATI